MKVFAQDIQPKSWKELPWAAFLFIFILNVLLKYSGAYFNSAWQDEAFSYFKAVLPPYDILFNSYDDLGNPPFYYILLHYWGAIFGYEVFSLRFFSLLMSAFTASFLFLIGLKLFDNRAGWIAALLFTVSTEHIFYAQEVRSYALLACICVVSSYFFIRFVTRNKNSTKHILVLGVLNALMMYINYAAIFFPIAQMIIVVFICRRKKLTKSFLLSSVLSLLLFIPQFLYLFYCFRNFSGEITWWWEKPTFEHFFHFWKYYWKALWAPAMLVLMYAIFYSITKKKRTDVRMNYIQILTVLFLSTITLNFIFSKLVISLFLPRYLDCFTIFVCLLFGGLASIYWHKIGVRIFSFSCILIGLYTADFAPTNGENWKAAAGFISKNKTTNNRVVVMPEAGKLPLLMYLLPVEQNQKVAQFDDSENQFFCTNTFNIISHLPKRETIFVASFNGISKEDKAQMLAVFRENYFYNQLEIHDNISIFYLKPLK